MSMTRHEIRDALLGGVDGHLPSMAAVELLLAHGSSIDRLQQAGLIEWSDPEHQPPMAWIDWYELDDQLSGRKDPAQQLSGASRSARNILRIATSLVTDHQLALGDVLHGLDCANTAHVANAVATAHSERRAIDPMGGPAVEAEPGVTQSDPNEPGSAVPLNAELRRFEIGQRVMTTDQCDER